MINLSDIELVSIIKNSNAREEWKEKYQSAKSYMNTRSSVPSVLIEVAAQHPLTDGKYPNEEFTKRLLMGIQLFENEIKSGNNAEIYVPGSIHSYMGVADQISLSEAGKQYLIKKNIPSEAIRGDELNSKYKGERGVYNSADECFVSASYFKDNNFGKLYSVVSPGQLLRKVLHYIEFGVLPLSYTAPVDNHFHDFIQEIFELIPNVLFLDNDMQSVNSVRANEERFQRVPAKFNKAS